MILKLGHYSMVDPFDTQQGIRLVHVYYCRSWTHSTKGTGVAEHSVWLPARWATMGSILSYA